MGGRTDPIAPPNAPRRPAVLRHEGDERVDDWYWLRERENPEVIEYLEAENAFTKSALAHTEPVQARIFDEIVARVEETDVSAPVRKDGWEYFTRSRQGLQYALHCRRPAGSPEPLDPQAVAGEPPGEELLLDENALAAGSGYFALGGFAVTPAHDLLAYSVDLTGGERYDAALPGRPDGRRRHPRSGRRGPRRLLRPRVGERRRHDLLHAPRRGDAPVPGVAPHGRHARHRRRARVRGARRALLRRRRPHAHRPLHRDHVGVEAHDRGLVRRRRHAVGRAARRRATRGGRRVPRRAPRRLRWATTTASTCSRTPTARRTSP